MNKNQSGKLIALAQNVRISRFSRWTVAVFAALTVSTQAASIDVPNGSFELQSGAGQPFGVSIDVDSWQKAPKPAYFDEATFGFLWIQTAGVFVDALPYNNNPYVNHDGTQAGYILAFPQVSLSQDLTAPDAVFTEGNAYSLTLGVFGKNITDGSTLQLSLFYRDNLNNAVTVGTPTTVTYSAAGFPVTTPINLFDYSVNIPYVQAGDAWAGKNIGIKIESTFGSGGNWDFDNARLVATPVPEPASLALLGLGLGGWIFFRARARRS